MTFLFACCELNRQDDLNPSAPSAFPSLLVAKWCVVLSWNTRLMHRPAAVEETASTHLGSFSATCGTDVVVEETLPGSLVDDQLTVAGVGTATL